MKKVGFLMILTCLFLRLSLNQTFAQSPGLIYKPSSTSTGKAVLDPNLDGWSSPTSSGFIGTDYGSGSELKMIAVPQLMEEPYGDPVTGGTGGHTDVVSVDGGNSVFVLKREFNGVDYFIIRFRIGKASTARKGYSLLIDTNNTFSGTGSNPGFEKEIILETGVGVKIYTHNPTNGTITSTLAYDLEAHHQRSIALSTNNDDPDYFYDFFVPYADLGIPAGTLVRFAATTITSAQSGINGTSSDVDGIDDKQYGGNTLAIYTALITSFPAVDLDNLEEGGSFGQVLSFTPSVTAPISTGSSAISGTSQELNGTTITIYKNGNTTVGTTTVSNNHWTLTGVSGLVIGDLISAKALASGKGESIESNIVEVVGIQSCFVERPAILSATNSGTITVTVSWNWPAGVTPTTTGDDAAIVRIYEQTGVNTFTLRGTATPIGTNGQVAYAVGGSGNLSGTFVATITFRSCLSQYSNTVIFQNSSIVTTNKTATPTILTDPILATTGSRDIVVRNNHGATADLKLFVNGVEKTTISNVASNTNATFTITGLIEGDRVNARAQGTLSTSRLSDISNEITVVETSSPSSAPLITGKYFAGANQTVSGSSTELPGTVIYLYKAGTVLLGTTTVNAFGIWEITGLTLTAGDVLTSKADASGKSISDASPSVTVASGKPVAPTLSGPIMAGQTSLSGTGGNGVITVYIDGDAIGTTSGASWTLSGVNPLDIFKGAEIHATNTVSGVESDPSNIITATGVMSFNISEPDDTSIDNQVAGDPFFIKISAKDATLGTGNNVTTFNSKVTIASTSFMLIGGGVSPNFNSGILDNFSVSLKTAGVNHKITAISAEDPTAFGEAILNIYPNTTSKFTLSGANSTNAGELVMQEVSRFDEFENLVTEGQRVVYLSAEQGLFKDAVTGGRLISQVTIPDGSSTASFWYTHTAAGDYQITASDTQVPNGMVGIDDAVKTITILGNSDPLSNNSNLADLQTDVSTFNPTFDPQVLSYSMTVINSVSSIGITAEPDDSHAEVWINGNYIEGPSYFLPSQPLAVGANIFKITVIAENGETKIYTLTITREADPTQDSDNDGVMDDLDLCPNTPSGAEVDENGCAESQKDSDNDGVTDDLDQCPNTPADVNVDANGCANSQKDTDGDGVTDDLDQCPNTPANSEVDENGCLLTSLPTVTTVSQSDVTATSVTLGGNVTSDGNSSITARGFVYSTIDNTPQIGESDVTDVTVGSGTGIFSEAVTGLSPSTTYYFRAYATNSAGTSYGGVQSFITLAGNQAPTDITLDNLTIGENVPANSTVGSFATTDSDTEDTHTYTLVAGVGDTDNGVFSISGDELILTESPNSTTKSSYTIRVRTTDAGNDYFEKSFTITVIDVTDPVISVPANAERNMDEDECSYIVQGTEFDPVSATDDSGVPPSLSYTIKRNQPNLNLVSENFNSGSWNPANFEIGSPSGSVVSGAYQSASDDDRGTLRTVADFQPTLVNPLHVTATLSFPSGEAIAFIGSRSDGLKNPDQSNEPSNSLYFRIHNFIDGYTGISDTPFDGRPGDSFYTNPVIVSFVDNGENITGTFTNTVTNEVLNFNENTNFNSGSWKVVFSGSGVRWDDIKISLGEHEYLQPSAAGTNSLAGFILLQGENTITWTAEDGAGNTNSETFVVTINDLQKPNILPSANLVEVTSIGDTNKELIISDAVVSDNCTIESLTWEMTGATVGSGSDQIGTYTFNTGLTTVTYKVIDGSGNEETAFFTVSLKEAQEITFDPIPTKTYGDTNFDLDASASSGLTVEFESSNTAVAIVSGNTVTIVGNGSTIITATQSGNDFYAAAEPKTQTLTVDKKALTITANNDSKTYGETYTFAGTEFTTDGLANEDEVTSVTLTSTGAAAAAEVNTYDILISEAEGTGLSNYEITYVKGTLTVGKKAVTITANDDSKTYGETYTFAGTEFTTEGLEDGDAVTSATLTSTGAPATAGVNTYDILISDAEGAGLSNYEITYVKGTLTVDKKALTITATDKTKVYGEANPALNFSYTGLVNGDTKVTTEPSISTTALASSNAGTYPITLEGGSDDNYTITLVNGTLTIDKKALTITADDKQKTYGEANPVLTFTYTGLVNGDTKVTTEPSISTTALASSNVGTYPITLSGGSDDNYTITLVNGTLTIGKKDLTITADDKQKT
ncbi:MAG: MBG domain-containing protein, partial [Algoriphagus sp.]|uniref:MBG domain-containing protein n=1 Tax=Algoriphagus sp. TaxID=1872435 RepID=UPI002736CFF7